MTFKRIFFLVSTLIAFNCVASESSKSLPDVFQSMTYARYSAECTEKREKRIREEESRSRAILAERLRKIEICAEKQPNYGANCKKNKECLLQKNVIN